MRLRQCEVTIAFVTSCLLSSIVDFAWFEAIANRSETASTKGMHSTRIKPLCLAFFKPLIYFYFFLFFFGRWGARYITTCFRLSTHSILSYIITISISLPLWLSCILTRFLSFSSWNWFRSRTRLPPKSTAYRAALSAVVLVIAWRYVTILTRAHTLARIHIHT